MGQEIQTTDVRTRARTVRTTVNTRRPGHEVFEQSLGKRVDELQGRRVIHGIDMVPWTTVMSVDADSTRGAAGGEIREDESFDADPGKNTYVPPAAFSDPTTPADAPPSIDVRSLVGW